MNTKFFIGCALVALSVVSCGGEKANANAKLLKTLPTVKVERRDTVVSTKFVADIQAKKNVEIHARIAGLMDQIHVNEGQKVRKGQTLFKLNDAELQIELLKAQATLKTAQADMRMAAVELRQMQALYDKKVIADNELELAQAKHEASEAKVAYAAAEKNAIIQQIGFTTVVAPFDGVIDRIPLKEGSLVQNGSLLTTVSELDEVLAYFSLPENIYFQMLAENRIADHKAIELILPNGVKYDHKGILETAEAEIDKYTGAIQFKVKFVNPEGLIKHGTSGKLIMSESKKDALIIPQRSVFSIQDKRFVFVVDKNQVVKMRKIMVAATLEDSYIVESGLEEGETIVREGTQSLRDGEKIKIKKAKKTA